MISLKKLKILIFYHFAASDLGIEHSSLSNLKLRLKFYSIFTLTDEIVPRRRAAAKVMTYLLAIILKEDLISNK